MLKESGLQPSRPDERDKTFRPANGLAVSNGLSLLHSHPPWDQADVPCCVSCAISVCLEILGQRQGDGIRLSPLFHYWVARDSAQTTGLELREGLKAAVAFGICSYSLHPQPMTAQGADSLPTKDAYEDAEARKLSSYDPRLGRPAYFRLPAADRIRAWQEALSEGWPLLIGFFATDGYFAMDSANRVNQGPAGAQSAYRHAAVAVGFDEDQRNFLVKDSRGESFGPQGIWWLPYAVADSETVEEAWTLTQISN